MNRLNQISSAVLQSPLVWGALLTVGFYTALDAGLLANEQVERYTARHWVEYVEMAIFFVGLSVLAVKALEVARQRTALGRPILPAVPPGGQPAADAGRLLEYIARLPASQAGGYLARRLRAALEHVRRKGAADTLDDEIRYLADLDAVRAAHSFAFLRIIVWAIPILGLLGTVIGITLVIANLSPQHLEEKLGEITSGLGVAFDTTALALGLSMGLMFIQYFVDRAENRLLADVDSQVNAELVGRFQDADLASADPQLGAVRRMIESVIASNDRLVARQAEIWRATIETADQRWRQSAVAVGQQLEQALAGALDQTLSAHAARLAEIEHSTAEQNCRQWVQVQQSLVATADSIERQQAELSRQSEVLSRIVDGNAQVVALETALNRNLAALAGAGHFEETVFSLAAAIQLLSARLGASPADLRRVELQRIPRPGNAA